MTQTQLLTEVLRSVGDMPPERANRIHECSRKIRAIVNEYNEDGMMALAIEGLKGAALAEQEEVRQRISDIREMA